MRYLIPLLIIILFTSSCRKLVEDNFNDFERKATINSFLATDSVLMIHLSETGTIGEGEINYIENADVNIYINNIAVQLNYKSKGIYSSNVIVESNTNYLCEVVSGNESITSNCYIPIEPILNSIEIHENAWIDENGELSPMVSFKIQNSPNDSMYFEAFVTVIEWHINEKYDTITWVPYMDTTINIEDRHSLGLFSNINENGSYFTKNIPFTLWSYSFPKPIYYYAFEIRALSKSAHKYLRSMELYNVGASPEFGSATPPPYNLYSNVNNGYGIFGGYSSAFSDTITDN